VQFEHDTGRGRVLAQDSDLPGNNLPTDFLLEEMHSARMVHQPTPQLVVDARREGALNARHLDLIHAGVYSAIRAPLVVHDTVRGAVSLWGEGAGRFTFEDADLLGTLTRPLALALEKASALESLGESELKYRSLVAQADEMIFLFEPVNLRLLDANSFTSRALGYPQADLTQLTLDRLLDAPLDEIVNNVAMAVADGELHLTDARFLRIDGSTIEVDAVASMVTFGGRQAVLVLARDVSERKALLRQLMQSQKMDSLGAMAGAVAHDFNNLLTTILGFAGLLKRSRNMDIEERENLALIEDAARRAADLTGRLLSFSRGGLVRFGKVDLRMVVEDTLQLAEPTMHAGLEVSRFVPETPLLVEGDSGQLQQALTNIVLNARDAMPEGGKIEVSLTVDGTVAVVKIADTGPGMDEETRVRIFEPFYTTKPLGSGTGLGMAITYGIVQGHHGDIAVESEPGRGTTFTISLPLLDVAGDQVPTDAFNAGEGNLVLVVDDDAMVRRTTTATLTELGYNVVEAPGGSTAVEILRARPDRFSAVLLDLVMPGMTGSETFRALTAVRPDLPVVVCTGYAADSHIDTDVKRRIAGLVQKPFTAERLARALAVAGAMPTRASRI
jgi:PAS domain S-box-containing protein